ncbi:MAG: hypothetical protein GY896_22905 [Gammaproteobacteria bacterium]|nr:hypothetical protein [Gammaproteobacteria bacterium]
MQTCATCRYFMLRENDDNGNGDCVRYPPKHIISGYDIVELEATDKAPVITMPSGVPARPLSMWLVEPKYTSAYDGVREGLGCGEWRVKEEVH